MTPRTPRTARQSELQSSLREHGSQGHADPGDIVAPVAPRGHTHKRSPPTAVNDAAVGSEVDHDQEHHTSSTASKRMRSANFEVCCEPLLTALSFVQFASDLPISLHLLSPYLLIFYIYLLHRSHNMCAFHFSHQYISNSFPSACAS